MGCCQNKQSSGGRDGGGRGGGVGGEGERQEGEGRAEGRGRERDAWRGKGGCHLVGARWETLGGRKGGRGRGHTEVVIVDDDQRRDFGCKKRIRVNQIKIINYK